MTECALRCRRKRLHAGSRRSRYRNRPARSECSRRSETVGPLLTCPAWPRQWRDRGSVDRRRRGASVVSCRPRKGGRYSKGGRPRKQLLRRRHRSATAPLPSVQLASTDRAQHDSTTLGGFPLPQLRWGKEVAGRDWRWIEPVIDCTASIRLDRQKDSMSRSCARRRDTVRALLLGLFMSMVVAVISEDGGRGTHAARGDNTCTWALRRCRPTRPGHSPLLLDAAWPRSIRLNSGRRPMVGVGGGRRFVRVRPAVPYCTVGPDCRIGDLLMGRSTKNATVVEISRVGALTWACRNDESTRTPIALEWT
jgi:hypothetical protein